MKSKFLLPSKFKKVGWIILIPSTIIGLILLSPYHELLEINGKAFAICVDQFMGNLHYFTIVKTNITNTLVGALVIIGALMVGFSKEKVEDEFIANLRLNSLLWAVLVNYLLLLFMFLFIYGLAFLNIMVYNMFTILFLFIAKFNIALYRNSKSGPNEELN